MDLLHMEARDTLNNMKKAFKQRDEKTKYPSSESDES
jgi:hypothetical protein